MLNRKKIEKLLVEHVLHKKNKDWEKADEVRSKIEAMGYKFSDTKDGYILEQCQSFQEEQKNKMTQVISGSGN